MLHKFAVLWPFVAVASKTFGGMDMMSVHIVTKPKVLILHFFGRIVALELEGF